MPSDDLDEFSSTKQRATLRIPPGFDLHDVPETTYMIGDVNVSARFHTFKQRALQAASERAGLQVDTQFYEIGALSHILIRYSNMMMTTFGEETLKQLYSQTLSNVLDFTVGFPVSCTTKVNDIIELSAHQSPAFRISRLDAMTQLLSLALEQQCNVSRAMIGLATSL